MFRYVFVGLLARLFLHSFLHAYCAKQGLYNGQVSVSLSVRSSVCPVDRQQQRRAAGLLLSAVRAGDIDR